MAANKPTTSRTPPKSPDNGEDLDDPMKKVRLPKTKKPIKIELFSIGKLDKLDYENAIYWFDEMKSQLEIQGAWEAIEKYAEVGPKRYEQMISTPDWERIDLKATLIIDQGLSPNARLEFKSKRNAGQKWGSLKNSFLPSSKIRKMLAVMKLRRMTSWTHAPNQSPMEGWRDFNKIRQEFLLLNEGNTIDIEELSIFIFLLELRGEYAPLRDSMLCSDGPLTRDDVDRRVKEFNFLKLLGGPQEKGSRAQRKGPKCFSCREFGHKAARCPNTYS